MDCSIYSPCSECSACTIFPRMPLGEFRWRNGHIMAAAKFFEIRITGRGAHAAQPHFGIDSIVAGSSLVSALQTIVSRYGRSLACGGGHHRQFPSRHGRQCHPQPKQC